MEEEEESDGPPGQKSETVWICHKKKRCVEFEANSGLNIHDVANVLVIQ